MEIHYKGKVLGSSGGGGGTSEEIYSTEEVRIGTWIDGKPLYRVSIVGNTGSVNDKTLLAEIKNVDTIVNLYGSLFRSDGYPGQFNINSLSQSWYILTYYENEYNGIVSVVSNQAFANSKIVATVEYTKTTDTVTISEPSSVVNNLLASSPMVSMPVTAPFLGEEVETNDS